MIAKVQTVKIKGKPYVLVPPAEYNRLQRLSEQALPPFPPANPATGNLPAVAAARVAIARTIIRQRQELGLTQQELARLAGVRQETICRLESGKHAPTKGTIDKIDRALKRTQKKGKPANHCSRA